VKAHGCYEPGLPLLLDGTQTQAADPTLDLTRLQAALAAALPDSPLALLVQLTPAPLGERLTAAGPVFTSRSEAIGWLATRWRWQ